jgi:HSP20 family protein
VDVKETTDGITVRAELPGLNPEDVNVSVQDGVLTISGEKKDEREEGKADTNYYLVERRYGRFERRFSLPSTVSANDVQANFLNGVLNVTLPKTEEAKPRRIEVKVERK